MADRLSCLLTNGHWRRNRQKPGWAPPRSTSAPIIRELVFPTTGAWGIPKDPRAAWFREEEGTSKAPDGFASHLGRVFAVRPWARMEPDHCSPALLAPERRRLFALIKKLTFDSRGCPGRRALIFLRAAARSAGAHLRRADQPRPFMASGGVLEPISQYSRDVGALYFCIWFPAPQSRWHATRGGGQWGQNDLSFFSVTCVATAKIACELVLAGQNSLANSDLFMSTPGRISPPAESSRMARDHATSATSTGGGRAFRTN